MYVYSNKIYGVSSDVYVKAMEEFTNVTWRQKFMSISVEK